MRVIIAYDATWDIIITDIADYSISIGSTPLDSNDSSGSVGDFSVTFHRPFDPSNHINSRGVETLEGKGIQFTSEFGTMYGLIDSATETDHNTIVVQCTSYAGGLNAYNVQARPIYASLRRVLVYYFSLGTSAVNVSMSPDIADRVVTYPGWNGELWYHLKLLCAAEDIQFKLTGQGVVYVEPIRSTEVSPYFKTSYETSIDSSNLAQKVEVREYNCEAWDNVLFYPRGGWSEDTEILSVNAGEYTEQTIELAGSIEAFRPPIMQTFVSRDHLDSSVYTVVAEDGFPVQPQQWEDAGGNISFEIGDDFQTMVVKMKGASGIRLDNGEEATSFSLALSSDAGGSSRYSTLRIVGDGVLHENEKTLVVDTGIPEEVTGTEVGASIDNPFLFDRERVAKAASLAARQFSGAVLRATGDATNLGSGFGLGDIGGRIKINGRPYRVREVTYNPGGLNFTADDDLTHEDVQNALQGKTYAQVQTENEGLTYRNVFARGVRYSG